MDMMNKIIPLLFYIFLTFSVKANWLLVGDFSKTKTWLHTENSDVTIVLKVVDSDIKSFSNDDLNKIYKKLEAKKKNALSLIGVTNWKVESYRWEKCENRHELKLEGDYSSQGKSFDFKESHIYMGNKNYQMLISRPKDSSITIEAITKKSQQFLKNEGLVICSK